MGVAQVSQRRRVSFIGIDIGRCGVRAVQLIRRQGRWHLAHTGRTEHARPPDRSTPADPIGPDHVLRAIRQSGFTGRKVVSVVGSEEAEYHSLTLPQAVLKGAEADVERAVRFEVSHLMTMEESGVQIRHWLFPDAISDAANAMGVAARDDATEEVYELIRGAGLDCLALDAHACALARLGSVLSQRDEGAIWGVLDLGASATRLTVCVRDTPVLIRGVGPGGDHWDKAIGDSLRISPSAAEVHKRDHGIESSGRGIRHEEDAAPASELAAIVFSVLRGDLKKLAGQIKRSYEYVLSRYPRGQAADLVLVGSGANMSNIDTYLSDTLGIAARRASSYIEEDACGLSSSLSRRDSLEEFAAAAGLALWCEGAR